MPKDVDDQARVDGAGGGIGQGKMGLYGGEDSELNYQERVAVIWIEKIKLMGPCTLDGVEGRRGCAEDTIVLCSHVIIG